MYKRDDFTFKHAIGSYLDVLKLHSLHLCFTENMTK